MSERARVEHLNPEGLPRNPAFTNVVAITGPAKTVYVGGQNAVNASGEIVGKGDMGAQTEQIFRNLKSALAAAGAKLEHVIKCNVYVVDSQPLQQVFEVFQREWGRWPNPAAYHAGHGFGTGPARLLGGARGRGRGPGMTESLR